MLDGAEQGEDDGHADDVVGGVEQPHEQHERVVKLIKGDDCREHLKNCTGPKAKKEDARYCEYKKPDSRKKAEVCNVEFPLADHLHAGVAERIAQVG